MPTGAKDMPTLSSFREGEITMSENQKRILQMLAEGKISVEEASRLLSLINEENGRGGGQPGAATETKPTPKYLYVRVEPKEGHLNAKHGRVNVRIPMGLIRAGIKFKSLVPPQAVDNINKALKEKGIGFDVRDLKDEDLESLVTALGEAEINVDSEEAEVRIHAE
jgi:hypothetical protein